MAISFSSFLPVPSPRKSKGPASVYAAQPLAGGSSLNDRNPTGDWDLLHLDTQIPDFGDQINSKH